MKAFIITQADLDRLKLHVDRDPKHGMDGGSSQASVRDKDKEPIYDEVHRFYNYQVHKWINSVTQDK